jgi:PAS domain-containing protein
MSPKIPDTPLEGERQFQLLADFVPQLMWLADRDGWIYWYNKRCYEYWDYSRADRGLGMESGD